MYNMSYTEKTFTNFGYDPNNVKKVLANTRFRGANISVVLRQLKSLRRNREAAAENAARREAANTEAAIASKNAEHRKALAANATRRAAANAARRAAANATRRAAAERAAANAEHRNALASKNAEHRNALASKNAEHRNALASKNAEHRKALAAKNRIINNLKSQIHQLKNATRLNEARRRMAEREKEAAKEENIKLRERYN